MDLPTIPALIALIFGFAQIATSVDGKVTVAREKSIDFSRLNKRRMINRALSHDEGENRQKLEELREMIRRMEATESRRELQQRRRDNKQLTRLDRSIEGSESIKAFMRTPAWKNFSDYTENVVGEMEEIVKDLKRGGKVSTSRAWIVPLSYMEHLAAFVPCDPDLRMQADEERENVDHARKHLKEMSVEAIEAMDNAKPDSTPVTFNRKSPGQRKFHFIRHLERQIRFMKSFDATWKFAAEVGDALELTDAELRTSPIWRLLFVTQNMPGDFESADPDWLYKDYVEQFRDSEPNIADSPRPSDREILRKLGVFNVDSGVRFLEEKAHCVDGSVLK